MLFSAQCSRSHISFPAETSLDRPETPPYKRQGLVLCDAKEGNAGEVPFKYSFGLVDDYSLRVDLMHMDLAAAGFINCAKSPFLRRVGGSWVREDPAPPKFFVEGTCSV